MQLFSIRPGRISPELMRYVVTVGLNSIHFETMEKQYKYYTYLTCRRLACCVAGEGSVIKRGWIRKRLSLLLLLSDTWARSF